VYSRVIEEEVVTFEASGGLLNAGLVMLDQETKSYWSIMTEDAIWGKHKGQRLQVLPGSQKITFGQWRDLHPETQVLSAGGTEHAEVNPYDRYFSSPGGFRGLTASDRRLPDKALLYGLHVDDTPWVIAHANFDSGAVATVGGRQLFLYRLDEDSPFQGTAALWLAEGDQILKGEDGGWALERGGDAHPFDPSTRSFPTSLDLEAATGFDTYWYIWSLTNPATQIADVGQ
jgi:hypothetical protein